MSDEFDGHSYDEGRQGRGASGASEQDSRLRGAKFDVLKAAPWSSRFVASLRTHPFLALLRKHLLLTVIVVLLLVPVGAVLLGYITRPAPGTESQAAGLSTNSADNTGAKAKPSAGKPLVSTPQAPLPVLSSSAPAPALPNQSTSGSTSVPPRPSTPAPGVPNAIPNTVLPAPTPGTVVKPPFTPMVYSARHDRHFGENCSGQLTLDSSGLTFKCGDDPRGSVQVALADIEAVDSNGIRLTSGKKYHFSIEGMARGNEQALFADWLSRVR